MGPRNAQIMAVLWRRTRQSAISTPTEIGRTVVPSPWKFASNARRTVRTASRVQRPYRRACSI